MFSVIIPTYNRLELLKRAIDSVLNQSFVEFEIIVVDDCSSDDTWEWLKENNDERIYPFRNSKNKGLSFNRNLGASKSSKPYLAFLDDDDIWLNNHLYELNTIISKFPNAGMYCNSYIINYGDKKVEAIHDNPFLLENQTEFNNFECFENKNALCAPSTIAIPKNIFESIGGFNIKTTVLEDVEFYIKIGLKFSIVTNRLITIEYAQNTGNHLSLNHIHLKSLPDLTIFKPYEKELPYLKKWLDNIRFQIGMKFLEVGDKKYKTYFSDINTGNLTYLKKIFIGLNYRMMNFILMVKKQLTN